MSAGGGAGPSAIKNQSHDPPTLTVMSVHGHSSTKGMRVTRGKRTRANGRANGKKLKKGSISTNKDHRV